MRRIETGLGGTGFIAGEVKLVDIVILSFRNPRTKLKLAMEYAKEHVREDQGKARDSKLRAISSLRLPRSSHSSIPSKPPKLSLRVFSR